MKNKFEILSIVITAMWGALASAQQTTTTDPSPNRAESSLGKLERADKIIGKEIRDSQDQKLGSVKDLAIDLQNGRIVEVIVGTGGLLGVDEQYRAVPPGKFTCDPERKELRLNVDKARFTEAPWFKMSEWEANVSQANVDQAYQYYGTQPYYTSEGQSDRNKTAAPKQLGEVERADKLVGTTVRNLSNERLGRVEDLIVDLPAGRVVEVILASGGFLGMGDELSAVPPQAFRHGTEANAPVLDVSKDTLTSAPHFKASQWPDLNNTEFVLSVYHAYNVGPYFVSTGSDNTAQNARDRAGNTLTPLNQGTSEADMDTTRQIRKQVMAASGLSVNARNIKIITLNGKVTLRGTVNTPDEKRIIDDIAVKVASQGNVDDQLQVENTSRSSAQ